MKVLIVSDIHGNFQNMKKVIQNDSSFDRLLLLGDILSGPEIEGYHPNQLALFLSLYKDKILSVQGNCDSSSPFLHFLSSKLFLTVSIDHHLFFMTHGHIYSPYYETLYGYDVILFN